MGRSSTTAVLFATALAVGDGTDLPPLAEALEAIRAEHHVPALAAARVEAGKVVEIAAVGVRRLGAAEPVTVDDEWHLGSCAKAMTAALAAKLVERGRWRFDTTLPELFPSLAEGFDRGWAGATLRQLLDQRSGLPPSDTVRSDATRDVAPNASAREQRRTIVAAALREPPTTPPGTVHAYSNVGWFLVGAAIEEALDEPFEQSLTRELLAPLGMGSAGFGPPGRGRAAAQPWGHSIFIDSLLPRRPDEPVFALPAWYAPAGDLHASLRDWAKFVDFAIAPADLTQDLRPLTAASRTALWPLDRDDDYAGGFARTTRPWTDGPVLAHFGGSAGWHCVVEANVKERTALLVTCNLGGGAAESACRDAVALLGARRLAGPAETTGR